MDAGDTVMNGALKQANSATADEGDALGSTPTVVGNVIAAMPVSIDSTHYKMDHPYRGVAVVFNHEHFDIPNLKSRSGTHVDCENFVNRLKFLGFQVMQFHNLNFKTVMDHVNTLASSCHTDYDCFLMAVFTHGEMGILYAKDTCYKPDSLWSPFTADRCPSLAGKPKLFFIQACQGDKLDPGVTMSRTETDGQTVNSYRIPTHADFMIAYSTIPGFYSWRNTTRGSWFIQALCEELYENAFKLDLLTIMTFVCRRVATDFESNTPDCAMMHRQKQIPCITTMLTRILRFTPKK